MCVALGGHRGIGISLLELFGGRYKKGSAIFCSQFDVGGWHEQIRDPTLADAIIGRIVHEAYKIVIEGTDSMRKRTGIHTDSAEM